jgi:hypothetical protein
MPSSKSSKKSGETLVQTLADPLRVAIRVLEQNGYCYAVIGGIALALWGIPRETLDVDIKVLVPNAEYPAARTILRTAFPKRARILAPSNPLIVAVEIQDVIVDFLLAVEGYENLIFERAVLHDLGGWSAWICSPEDLIIQKMIAGRSKDLPDVENILAVQGRKLDQTYIKSWLSEFAEVLEKPEILAEYERLLRESKGRR